ncbi:family 78 glycoside hydrolase catalytic domain [Halocatena marina]|uniref:family 78 glycoside hydrolase catalytic domain n=1 Tax=Halocatena marina TaxID=2934937 RepID=UPI0020100804|nr:family 78 glycoside hydrolase catalytic domain [Halocatena marina]
MRLDTVAADIPTNRDWNAHWIWTGDDPRPNNAYYYVRTEFELDELSDLTLYVTADTRYKLFVNGERVGEGPMQSQPFYKYYDTYDLDEFLDSGRNCVAAVINYSGTMEDTRGGFLAELANGGDERLVTDESWRITEADAWERDTFETSFNLETTHQEHYDARQAPDGWTEVGFDDGDWCSAVAVGGTHWDDNGPRPAPAVPPWTHLVKRDIPEMKRSRRTPEQIEDVSECLHLTNRQRPEDRSITLSQSGSSVTHTTISDVEALREGRTATVQNSTDHLGDHTFNGVYDPCIVLDFGRVVTARIELELDGPSGGTIDIGYAERLVDGEFNNAVAGSFADQYVMRGDEDGERFRTFSWKGFRYVKLRFSDCFEPTDVSLTAEVTRYPFEELGGFESDDETLNDVFEISRETLRLCSNESIMDTPWREQRQWLGDASAVTLGGIYSCFGDTALPAKFLRQSGANQQVTGLLANVTDTASHNWEGALPDYSLWWVIALWEHYRYTGEDHWIHNFYPQVQSVVQVFVRYVDDSGLLADVPFWPIMDWADLDRRGEFGPLNALFYGALKAVREMARLKGDDHTAELATELRAGIAEGFEKRLYDADRGCLVDANLDGQQVDHVSEHCNVAAIHFGLVDGDTEAEIIDALYESESVDYVEAQPFFTTVVLQALDDTGRFDLALDVLRERWGERMVERGYTSTLEEWTENGSWRDGEFFGIPRSHSHAWSAHPAEFLVRNLTGFEIIEPGCGTVAFDPKETEFEYEVTIPTPEGPIHVSRTDGKVRIDAPPAVTVA